MWIRCSVVFASAYRTSVLFTYSDNDPTYTLAPTVGWTAIEMSAGIISACLPTLLPIVLCCARAFGHKRPTNAPIVREPNAPPTFGGSGGKPTKCKNPSTAMTTFGTQVDHDDPNKVADGPFYRLPDKVESDSVISQTAGSPSVASEESVEPHLRPDTQGYGHSVKSYTVKGNVSQEDDIPLQGIRVQRDFKKLTSKKR